MQNQPPSPTDREHEVLQLLLNDLSLSEVADEMGISYDTVQFHLKNLKHKYEVKTLHGLVAKVSSPPKDD